MCVLLSQSAANLSDSWFLLLLLLRVLCYTGAPLIMEGGLKIGTLCVLDTIPHTSFNTESMMNLVDLAKMVVVELNLRKRLKQSQLGYITATAHNLQTPLSCFELSLQLLKASCLGNDHADVFAEAETSLDAMKYVSLCCAKSTPVLCYASHVVRSI